MYLDVFKKMQPLKFFIIFLIDCFQGFYAVSNLAKHLWERHRKHEDGFEDYVCIYCGRNATDKKEMQLHLAIKHPDELAYTCLRILKDAHKVSGKFQNL